MKLLYKHKEPINLNSQEIFLHITSLNIPLDEEDGDGWIPSIMILKNGCPWMMMVNQLRIKSDTHD